MNQNLKLFLIGLIIFLTIGILFGLDIINVIYFIQDTDFKLNIESKSSFSYK